MNILIVDDNPTNRKLLRVTLEAAGLACVETADGVEALAVLEREKVDAIISDILMPRMDGYRLCHEVRIAPHLSHLPFIIFTSTYTSPSDEKLSLDLGADAFIRKPASAKTIVRALEEAIATGRRLPAAADAPISEGELMKEYSARLVAKLEQINVELQQRIRLAALSADVAAALTQGSTLREILQRCSEAFVQHLDAAFTRIWTHNEREKVLELQASAGMYTHINGPHGRVPVGKSKIGLIAEERKPHLTNSVIGDPRVPEQDWARREGLVAFAGYPLIIGDRVVGVIAMFARHSLSQASLDAMASIADGVALGIERKREAEELRSTHDQLQQLLAHSPAVSYKLKIEGRNVIPTFVSNNIQRLLGVTVAESMSYDWWLNSLHPTDRGPMVATRADSGKEEGYTAEYRIRHGDGTYRWVVDNNRVVRDVAGQPQGAVGVWTDITERKRAEAELEQMHHQLLAASRQAGMAEFATGVLHNVGNVLNSVNVASTCVSDGLKRSKSVDLSKVVALMREHEADLGAFFTDDPRGKQVPGYLAKLADHLAGEQATALAELGELQKNIEHIKYIITVQQDSASRSRSPEALRLADLVEDALEMNGNGLRRSGIEVIKEFDEIPPVVTEKHKVLQILVNLVRNAMQACEGSGGPQKRLTIRVSQEAGRTRVAVADNGSGILPENLPHIFGHGFTTKPDGHGFGLHGAAQAAKEMRGSLAVHSDGPGHGATFTLEFPLTDQPSPDTS